MITTTTTSRTTRTRDSETEYAGEKRERAPEKRFQSTLGEGTWFVRYTRKVGVEALGAAER